MNALIWFAVCACILGLAWLAVLVIEGDEETDKELKDLNRRMRGEE